MALFEQGYSFIAGVDEAGRGCLAGPVVAAAVILPLGVHELASHLAGVRDSKQMTAQARDRLYDVMMLHALATSVGMGSVELIDERNILQATKHAMYAAIAQLSVPVQALLIDALILPRLSLPQRPIIKGDERCLSIAAASIVAKVTRDRLMLQLHEQYPLYGLTRIRAMVPRPTWPHFMNTVSLHCTGKASLPYGNSSLACSQHLDNP